MYFLILFLCFNGVSAQIQIIPALENETKDVLSEEGRGRHKRSIPPRRVPGQSIKEYVWEGVMREFVCKIKADPKPNITWLYFNITLEEKKKSRNFTYYIKQTPTKDMGDNIYQSIVTINYDCYHEFELRKQLTCNGQNELGSINITIDIQYTLYPAGLEEVEVERVDSTEVVIKIKPSRNTGKAPLTGYNVQIFDSEWNLITSLNFSLKEEIKITGLHPSTTYNLVVFSVNIRGEGGSRRIAFNTTQALPFQTSTLQSQSETVICNRFNMIFMLVVSSLAYIF